MEVNLAQCCPSHVHDARYRVDEGGEVVRIRAEALYAVSRKGKSSWLEEIFRDAQCNNIMRLHHHAVLDWEASVVASSSLSSSTEHLTPSSLSRDSQLLRFSCVQRYCSREVSSFIPAEIGFR